jgi:hypothetical protein
LADVFHIDVDEYINQDDNRSKMSGMSAVTEWMKTIRVVASCCDTKTSEMTLESLEQVEPSSAKAGEDMASLDSLSLETSLAASLVEV